MDATRNPLHQEPGRSAIGAVDDVEGGEPVAPLYRSAERQGAGDVGVERSAQGHQQDRPGNALFEGSPVPVDRQLGHGPQGRGRSEAEQSQAGATGRLNRRLAVLGEREREAVALERAAQTAGSRLARLEETAAGAEAEMIDQQTALATVEIEVADAERTLSARGVKIAEATSRLGALEGQVAEVQGKLDHALVAKDVAELHDHRSQNDYE